MKYYNGPVLLVPLSHLLSRRRISAFGHVARLDDGPAPSRPRNKWLTSYETTPHVRLESSGDVRAVDRGHGGATTQPPSPATRT